MILALNTSTPTCRFVLLEKGEIVAEENWLAERRLAKELLKRTETFLTDNKTSFYKLTGLIVYKGPGSFTGLRIGISFMNTLAYSLTIQIVGQTKINWLWVSVKQLQKGVNQRLVVPEYGSLPHINASKKIVRNCGVAESGQVLYNKKC